MVIHQKFLCSTACDECFRRSETIYRRKNFSIHRVTHRLCTTCGTYSTGYPQACWITGFVLARTPANVAQVPVSGWNRSSRQPPGSGAQNRLGILLWISCGNVVGRKMSVPADTTGALGWSGGSGKTIPGPLALYALLREPHHFSGTHMEDGFVSNAFGLNRGLTVFRGEPQTSAGYRS